MLLCLALVGCGQDPAADLDAGAPARITVTSAAFEPGGAIPARFTCDGGQFSPPLAWSGQVEGLAAWALAVADPDAPGNTFVHWVVLDIPRRTRSVEPGSVPLGSVQAVNSAGEAKYTGPCPPSGVHRYRFTVYALSSLTGLRDGADLEQALDAIASGAIARGTLLGTYRRGGRAS